MANLYVLTRYELGSIKIMNMIKMYGKPIRVNMVWMSVFIEPACSELDIAVTFLVWCLCIFVCPSIGLEYDQDVQQTHTC